MSRARKKTPRTYSSPLREAQAEATQKRVVDAAIKLLGHDPTTFTVPRVAREAGVSQPTVYRLFPDKEALAEAATNAVRQYAGADATSCSSSEEVIARHIASMRKIEAQPPEVIAAAAVLSAKQLTEENVKERVDSMFNALSGELRGVPLPARRRVATLISMFYSSTGATMMWRHRMMNEEGRELFAWLVRALLQETLREGKKR